MTIALFGATGGTGREGLGQALAKGMSVTALARTPEKLADITDPRLTVMKGDALVPADVASAVAGADAVVVVLGTPPQNAGTILSTSTANVIAAMKAAGVKRLIVQSSLGVGESAGRVALPMRAVMKTVLGSLFSDKDVQEKEVRGSGLEWTILRPATLGTGKGTGSYSAGEHLDGRPKAIDRADVARFIVDELKKPRYVGKIVELGGA